jgi:hypothetical protein
MTNNKLFPFFAACAVMLSLIFGPTRADNSKHYSLQMAYQFDPIYCDPNRPGPPQVTCHRYDDDVMNRTRAMVARQKIEYERCHAMCSNGGGNGCPDRCEMAFREYISTVQTVEFMLDCLSCPSPRIIVIPKKAAFDPDLDRHFYHLALDRRWYDIGVYITSSEPCLLRYDDGMAAAYQLNGTTCEEFKELFEEHQLPHEATPKP